MLCSWSRIIFLTLATFMLLSTVSINREYAQPAITDLVTVESDIPVEPVEESSELNKLVSQQDVYVATAYCLRGKTFTGSQAAVGTIGVDPSLIPLGSRLYITGYGFGVATDIGGVIQGKIIDVWLPSYNECISWGRQNVTVYVLKEGVSDQEFLKSIINQ